MKTPVTIGIVGCGAHSQIAHIPVYVKHPLCKVLALCDTEVVKLDYLSAKYDIPYKYHDFQGILDNKQLDALVIATPNYLHAPMTIAALNYGKHVLCENPMAISHEEASEMIDVARTTGSKLAIAMNNRLRPDVKLLGTFIKEGELGNIYYIKAGWLIGTREWILKPWRLESLKSGGGAFLSLGTNLLDIALFFLKNKTPSTIFASIHKKEPDAEVEDTAMCMINFTDNTLLTIEVSWSLLFEEDFLYCNVFGNKGAALLNPLRIQKELHNNLFNVTPTLTHANVYKASYEKQGDRFLRFLLHDETPPITCEDGLAMAELSTAFYESAKTKKLIPVRM